MSPSAKSARAEITDDVVRETCNPALTKAQFKVCELLSTGLSVEQVAAKLKVGTTTVKFHVAEAATRIPGDLPARFKLIAWYRGATRQVLEGFSSPDAALRRALGIHVHG